MEALSRPTPTLDHSLINPLQTMATENSQYLALGDVHTDISSPTDAHSFDDSDMMTSTPAPVIITSRPAKKRKSWGQELPEPKTTLPPRKRAKTDDEKEQRRIERIKRNRAAAHNSRERKRQETETLAVALARANAELDAYRKLHGPLPASIVLPEVTLCTEDPDTPAPSLSESRSSIDDRAHTPSTPETAFHVSDNIDIKQEPLDLTSSIQFSPKFAKLDGKPSTAAFEHFDPTQHSAAMLCDLPCRSNSLSSRSSGRSPASPGTTKLWTHTFLCIMTLQLQQCYRTLMLALWTTSPSRMARMMQLSATRSSRSTTSSTLPPLSRSTPGCLALSRTATGPSAPLRSSVVKGSVSRESNCSSMQHSSQRCMALEVDNMAGQSMDGRRRRNSAVPGKDLDGSDS